jgi:hydrogenase maturation protease
VPDETLIDNEAPPSEASCAPERDGNGEPPAETVVLGLGNLIRSDDGVGLVALQRLGDDPRIFPEVGIVEGGTKGLELVSYVSGASRLLILDAVEVSAPAGTILRLDGEALASLPGSGSVHELAVADILVALRMLGCEPQETVLLGVQPETTELGTSLSPRIEAAVPELVEAALRELRRWGCSSSSAPGISGPSAQSKSAVPREAATPSNR